jgi:catechol 2,3-dioxygenase
MIRPERIGHVVIKVRNLERSKKFYTEVVGLDLMGEVSRFRIAFLASNRRDHHELGLLEVGDDAPEAQFRQPGLLHVAFRLPDYETLRAKYAELKAHGVKVNATTDHGVALGVYFPDPDGNEIEFYVDGTPDHIAEFDNPYAGTGKLDFASDEPGLLDALSPTGTGAGQRAN